MEIFKRIYFDTSVLVAENWPRLSAKLRSCLELARLFKIRVCLPDVVEQELEARWLRYYDEAFGEAKRKIDKLERYVLGNKVEVNIPPRDQILEIYRCQARDAKNANYIESIPLTKAPLEKFVEMAVNRHLPFEDEGKGFQDAVIYLSILDHLDDATGDNAVFVARDKVYDDADVAKLAIGRNLHIKVFESVERLHDALTERLDKTVRKLYEDDWRKAREALEAKRSEIESFISTNLEIPESAFPFIGKVTSIQRVQLGTIEKVVTPNPLKRKEGEQVEIYFEAQIDLHVTIESYSMDYPKDRMLKVGQQALAVSLPGLAEALAALSIREQKIVQKVVILEATANYVGNQYSDIHPTAVVFIKELIGSPSFIARALGPSQSG